MLELRNIKKAFGDCVANEDVSITVKSGTIHAIVGENGAGKSTIMKIAYGFYKADAGEILVNGQPVTIRNPHDAIALGIGMVHQHFMLVDTMTVAENIARCGEADGEQRHGGGEGQNLSPEAVARLETLLLHGLERDELEGLAGHYFDALERLGAELDHALVSYWHEATRSVHEARRDFGRGSFVEGIERACIAHGPAVLDGPAVVLARRRRRRSLRARAGAR